VKPAPFDYIRASSMDHALATLSTLREDVTVLAGGQSLLPTMNLRLSRPGCILDISGLASLRSISESSHSIHIGALARHIDVLESAVIHAHVPLLRQAMPNVAHAAVRNRGTFGGSIANADPAAEIPACCVALGATVILKNAEGERHVPAEEYFVGLYESVRQPDELLVGVDIPKRPGQRTAFHELALRRGDFAVVGVAAMFSTALRIVIFGCEPFPKLSPVGTHATSLADEESRTRIIEQAVVAMDPLANLHGDADMKREWARVLLRRCLADIAG